MNDGLIKQMKYLLKESSILLTVTARMIDIIPGEQGIPALINTLAIANMKTTLKTLINLPYNNNSHERRRNSNICSMVM